MEPTKSQLCDAIAYKLTEWLGDEGRVDVINSNLAWFSCTHNDRAELALFKELLIDVPEYYDEKHWVPGESVFSFFVTSEIYKKIHERVVKEMRNE